MQNRFQRRQKEIECRIDVKLMCLARFVKVFYMCLYGSILDFTEVQDSLFFLGLAFFTGPRGCASFFAMGWGGALRLRFCSGAHATLLEV